jgi:hypothetical protein
MAATGAVGHRDCRPLGKVAGMLAKRGVHATIKDKELVLAVGFGGCGAVG